MNKGWSVDDMLRSLTADTAGQLPGERVAAREATLTAEQAAQDHHGSGPPAPITPPGWNDPNGRIEPVFGLPEAPHGPAFPPLVVRDDGWQDTSPHPWRRYFARMIDVLGLGMALWVVVGLLVAAVSPHWHERVFESVLVQNLLTSAILTCAITWPVNAFITGLTGTSIGKWLFGVRITDRDGRPIGIAKALRREADALFYGLGLGLPIVVLFTAYTGYNTLKAHGETTWDERKPWVVTHRPRGVLQVACALLGAVLWISIVVTVQMLRKTS